MGMKVITVKFLHTDHPWCQRKSVAWGSSLFAEFFSPYYYLTIHTNQNKFQFNQLTLIKVKK
jgi:hypothetical protein